VSEFLQHDVLALDKYSANMFYEIKQTGNIGQMWQIFDLYSLQAFESAVTNHKDFNYSLLVCL